jgi:predicted nuclease with TOPRIM domain
MEDKLKDFQVPNILKRSNRTKRSITDTTQTNTATRKKTKPSSNTEKENLSEKIKTLEFMANKSARLILILAQKNNTLETQIDLLKNQTNRLANRINSLETENQSLHMQIQTFKEPIHFATQTNPFPQFFNGDSDSETW